MSEVQGHGVIHPRNSNEALWALACHFSAYAMFFFPFGHLIGPLIVWLAKRDDYALVNEHGKASLNFQLTMSLVFLGYTVLFVIFVFGLFASGAIDMVKSERLDFLTAKIILLVSGSVLSIVFALLTGLYYWIMIAVNGVRAYDGRPAVYLPSIRFLV